MEGRIMKDKLRLVLKKIKKKSKKEREDCYIEKEREINGVEKMVFRCSFCFMCFICDV